MWSFRIVPCSPSSRAQKIGTTDPDLTLLIDAWATLPEAVKAGIATPGSVMMPVPDELRQRELYDLAALRDLLEPMARAGDRHAVALLARVDRLHAMWARACAWPVLATGADLAEPSTFRLMLNATAAVAFGTRIDRLPKPIRRMMSLAVRCVPPAARGRYVAEVRAVLERELVRMAGGAACRGA